MKYFDFNAQAPLRDSVRKKTIEAMSVPIGNASSVHTLGRASRQQLTQAREKVADIFGVETRDVVFTSGGSEGAALAIKGGFDSRPDKKRTKVVTSTLEHSCVTQSVAQLAKTEATPITIRALSSGLVDVDALLSSFDEQVALVSLQWVNNETGVIQPVAQVSREAQKKGILVHTDAVQAIGKIPLSFRDAPVDFLSISGHKFGSPPGIGALLVSKSATVEPLVPGHHEDGRRGGTSPVLLTQMLTWALEESVEMLASENLRLTKMRDHFENRCRELWPELKVNGATAPRVANTSNICFSGVDAEALLIALDLKKMCVSAGSACASGSSKPSSVLTAMGLSPKDAQSSLRFSFGFTTKEGDVGELLEALHDALPKCRFA